MKETRPPMVTAVFITLCIFGTLFAYTHLYMKVTLCGEAFLTPSACGQQPLRLGRAIAQGKML